MQAFVFDSHVLPLPPGHRFPASKYRLLRERLAGRHGRTPPGLIFYLAGTDPHEGDRLGRLKVSAAGLAERDRRVLAAARERRIPTALSMAGGYGRAIEDTVQVQLGTIDAAQASRRQWNNAAP